MALLGRIREIFRRGEPWERTLKHIGATCLPHNVQVVIPDRCKPDCGKAYKRLRLRMTELFKGTTTYDAEGTWVDPSGRLVPEHVKVIESAHSCMTPEQSRKFIAMVREAAQEARQEEIAIKSGQFMIVPTKALGKTR